MGDDAYQDFGPREYKHTSWADERSLIILLIPFERIRLFSPVMRSFKVIWSHQGGITIRSSVISDLLCWVSERKGVA